MNEIILIPAYEPDEKLVHLVKKISKTSFDVVVVNDGSNSSYDNIFDSIKDISKVISYKNNKGKGFAIKTGLNYIKNSYDKDYVVVTMDCDGQHRIEDAIKLCAYAKEHPDTLVLGKRLRGKNTPIRSKVGNTITRLVYSLSTKTAIYDTQTGLRAFSNDLISFLINVSGNRFEYEMNVLMLAPRNSIKIKELEIETIYFDNNSNSHFNTFKDSYRVYKEIIKFSLSSIISFIMDYLLFIILFFATNKLILSNIIARVVSATFNYSMNRTLVFNKNKSVYTLTKYFILATIILILNTTILNIFVEVLLLNPMLSKIITEILLFIFSYTIQKNFIFKNKN